MNTYDKLQILIDRQRKIGEQIREESEKLREHAKAFNKTLKEYELRKENK